MNPEEIRAQTLEGLSTLRDQGAKINPYEGFRAMPNVAPGGIRDYTVDTVSRLRRAQGAFVPPSEEEADKPGVIKRLSTAGSNIATDFINGDYEFVQKVANSPAVAPLLDRLAGLGVNREIEQFGAGGLSMLTGGLITPEVEAPQDTSEMIARVAGSALGLTSAISGISKGLLAIASRPASVATFLSKYPTVSKYLISIGAFNAYGQLDPNLEGDFRARLKRASVDTALGLGQTYFSSLKGIYGIPSSVGLGYGLTKLSGGSNEEALTWGVAFGILDALTRYKGAGMHGISSKAFEGNIRASSEATLGEFGYKVKEGYTNKDLTKILRESAQKYHPDKPGVKSDASFKRINEAINNLKRVPEAQRTRKSQPTDFDLIKEELATMFGRRAKTTPADVARTEANIKQEVGFIEPPGGFAKTRALVPLGGQVTLGKSYGSRAGQVFTLPPLSAIPKVSDAFTKLDSRINELQGLVDGATTAEGKQSLKTKISYLAELRDRLDPQPKAVITSRNDIPVGGRLEADFQSRIKSIKNTPPQTPDQFRALSHANFTIQTLDGRIVRSEVKYDPRVFLPALEQSNPTLAQEIRSGKHAKVLDEEVLLEKQDALLTNERVKQLQENIPQTVQKQREIKAQAEKEAETTEVPEKEKIALEKADRREKAGLASVSKKTGLSQEVIRDYLDDTGLTIADLVDLKPSEITASIVKAKIPPTIAQSRAEKAKEGGAEVDASGAKETPQSGKTEPEKQPEQQTFFKMARETRESITNNIIERLNTSVSRETVSRQFIQDMLNQKGIKDIEKQITEMVLKEFDGETVNVQEFKDKMRAQTMELTVISSDTYASYGTENIRLDNLKFGDHPYEFKTHIYNSPFDHGNTGHFTQDYSNNFDRNWQIKELIDEKGKSHGFAVYVDAQFPVVNDPNNLTPREIAQIHDNVGTVASTREDAEAWIKSTRESAGVPTAKGLFGHSRIADPMSKKKQLELREETLKQTQGDLDTANARLQDLKDAEAFLVKNREKVEKALNEKIAEQGGIDSVQKENDFRVVLSNAQLVNASESIAGKNEGSLYSELEVSLLRFSDSFIATPEGKLDWDATINRFRESEIGRQEHLVKVNTDGIKSVKDRMKEIEKSEDPEEMTRYILEIQSDAFQMGRVANAVARAEGDLKRSMAQLKEYEVFKNTIKQAKIYDEYEGKPLPILDSSSPFVQESSFIPNRYLFSSDNIVLSKKEALALIDESIRLEKEGLDQREKELGELRENQSIVEKQFFSLKNNWHERVVREEIRDASMNGITKLLFPTPHTVAKIEGYIGEDDAMPYEWNGDSDPEVGDKIYYGGEEMEVVERADGGFKVAPADKVHSFMHSDNVSEMVDSRWGDAKYDFEQVQKDFGEVKSVDDAQAILDKVSELNRYIEWKKAPEELRKLNNSPDVLSDWQKKQVDKYVDLKNGPEVPKPKGVKAELLERDHEYYLDGSDLILDRMVEEGTIDIDDIEESIREELYTRENDVDYKDMGYAEVFYEEIGYDTRVITVEDGAIVESFENPDYYDKFAGMEPSEFNEDFRDSDLSSEHKTILDFYDKRILGYLEKIKPQQTKSVTDEYDNEWIEIPITPQDSGPVMAFRMSESEFKTLRNNTIPELISNARKEQRTAGDGIRTRRIKPFRVGTQEDVTRILTDIRGQMDKLPSDFYNENSLALIEDFVKNVPAETLGSLKTIEILNGALAPDQTFAWRNKVDGFYSRDVIGMVIRGRNWSPETFHHEYAHHYYEKFLSKSQRDTVYSAYQNALKDETVFAEIFGSGSALLARKNVSTYIENARESGIDVDTVLVNEFFAFSFEHYSRTATREQMNRKFKGTAFEPIWNSLKKLFKQIQDSIRHLLNIVLRTGVKKSGNYKIDPALEKIFKDIYEPQLRNEGGRIVSETKQKEMTIIDRFYETESSIAFKATDDLPDRILELKQTRDLMKANGQKTDVLDKKIANLEAQMETVEKVAEKKQEKAPAPSMTDYQKGILDEIASRGPLPKIQRGIKEWRPNTIGFNNPYTRKASEIWEKGKNGVSDVVSRLPEAIRSRVVIKETKELLEVAKEKNRVISAVTDRIKDEILKPVSKLPKEDQETLGLAINKYIDVPTQYEGQVKNIDIEIGRMSLALTNMREKWIRDAQSIEDPQVRAEHLKMLDKLLAEDVVLQNLGKYARHFYVRPEPGEKKFTFKPSQSSVKQMINTSSFKRRMTLGEWGKNALIFEGRSEAEIGNISQAELEKIGLEAKKAYGWVVNADAMLEGTFKNLTMNYANYQWLDYVASEPSLVSKDPVDGWIKAKEILPRGTDRDIRLGPVNDKYINPVLKNELRDMIENKKSDMERAMDWMISTWKAGRVPLSPGSVVRNFTSGSAIQNDLAGAPIWNPSNGALWASSIKSYLTKGEIYKQARDAGQFGDNYYEVEISADDARTLSQITDPQGIIDFLAKVGEGYRNLASFYGAIDHFNRTYLHAYARRNGATAEEAVHYANKWQLDYRLVSWLVDFLRRMPSFFFTPFISFYALMLPRIMETLITRPWVLAKYPVIFYLLNKWSTSVIGETDESIEAQKPEWLQDQRYVLTMPTRDANGDPQFLNLSYVFPFGAPETAFIDFDSLKLSVESGSFFGITSNLANNYDPFLGREIVDPRETPTNQILGYANYTIEQVGPGGYYHLRNLWGALMGEVIGQPPYERQKDVFQAGTRLLGFPVYSGGTPVVVNKITALEREVQDRQSKVREIISNKNLSPQEQQQQMNFQLQKIQEIYSDNIVPLLNLIQSGEVRLRRPELLEDSQQ